MASPICTVQDGGGGAQATSGGVNATPGNTVTVALVSTAGADVWQLSIFGTDELVATPALTINSVTKTATFVAPAAGSALGFKSTVITSATGTTVSATFGVYTLQSGKRAGFAGETIEGDATFGWTSKINSVLRSTVFDPSIDYDGRSRSIWGVGGASPANPKATIDSVRAFLATTDATANQVVDTYQLALNASAWVSCMVMAKLNGAAGSAFWRVADGLVERFGAGAAAIKLAPAITLVGAYDGLSTMTAGAVTFALSATTGAVDVRFTGLAATTISVSAFRQAPTAAQ